MARPLQLLLPEQQDSDLLLPVRRIGRGVAVAVAVAVAAAAVSVVDRGDQVGSARVRDHVEVLRVGGGGDGGGSLRIEESERKKEEVNSSKRIS